MRFIFVHAWGGFSLAEWYLREALSAGCRGGVEVRSVDVPPHGVPANDYLPRAVLAFAPDVVGFSCHYWSTPSFLEAARWVKHLRPEARVVFGGPQVASKAVASSFLGRHAAVDFVIRGPGEEPLVGLMEAIAGRGSVEEVPSLSWRSGKEVIHGRGRTDGRARGPIFHAGNRDLAERLEGLGEASYETVRGCRQGCIYCHYPFPGMHIVDDGLVESEISWLLGLRIPNVRICDAHFGHTAERAKALLRVIARNNHRTCVRIYPDLGHVDAEYLGLVREAGARVTSIGIQTTNPASLKAIRRVATHEHGEAIRLLLAAFPDTPADLITGLPGDDVEGIERSFRDVLDLGFRAVNVFRLRVFPGTALEEEMERHLGGDDIFLTAAGQVLESPRFARREQRRIVDLTHALEIVAPLERARRALASSGGSVLDLAGRMDSTTLMDLASCTRSHNPARILARLPDLAGSVASLAPGSDARRVRDAVVADVAEHLRSTCAEARVLRFSLSDGRAERSVSRVVFMLESGGSLEWDLDAATVRGLDAAAPAPGKESFEILVMRGGGAA